MNDSRCAHVMQVRKSAAARAEGAVGDRQSDREGGFRHEAARRRHLATSSGISHAGKYAPAAGMSHLVWSHQAVA